MRNKTIQYAIDLDTYLTISRVGNEVAYFVYDFEGANQQNNYQMDCTIEKGNIHDILPYMRLRWTKKLDIEIKNIHRKFWQMPILKINKKQNA